MVRGYLGKGGAGKTIEVGGGRGVAILVIGEGS